MANKRPPLSSKRQQYAEQRKSGFFVGKPLSYPAGPMHRYGFALARLIDPMLREYERELSAVFREYGPDLPAQDASLASQARIALNRLQQKFAKAFRSVATGIVSRIFGQVDKASAASLGQSLKELSGGLTLQTNIMPAALAEAVTARTAENVALIKSIPQAFHEQIAGAVMRSVQPGGRGLADVTEALRKYGGITQRRADFIARDQVSKLTSVMNAERSKALGIRNFRWLHSGGGAEPRKLHLKLSGQVFSYDDLPVIDERTKERGLPGQLPNCRCRAVPLVEF